MRTYINIIILMLTINLVSAQDYKFGKVSQEEIEEVSHPINPNAHASILYKNESINFFYTESDGFMQERTIHERIKIYDKEGDNWATKKVYLYVGGSGGREKLSGVKGFTYNIVDGKLEKDKLKSNGVFEEDFNEYTEINTLTMPNVQPGSVIEYTYKITSPYLVIDDIYLQSLIPTKKLEVKIATPQYYIYNRQTNLKAFYQPNIVQSKENKIFRKISQSPRGGGANFAINKANSSTNYFDNVLIISDENIPGITKEPYSGNLDNFVSKLSLELSSVVNEFGVPQESFSTSWEKVSKTIYDYSSFGSQLKRQNFFKDDIIKIIDGIVSPFEKASVIHGFVKSKVKWNGNYGFTSHNGIKDAYKDGVGNVGDINLLMTTMLKSQGINAFPVLVSTRDNGIPLFPTRKGFNYVITLVEDQGKYVLLDATEPFSEVNVLPERALNWQGRLIKDDGTSGWISLRPTEKSIETTSLNIKINADFTITGKIRKNLTSHLALRYRDRFSGVSNDDHIKQLEKNKGDLIISEFDFANDKDISKPVLLSYNYESTDAIDEIGENLYFSPLVFLTTNESPFKLDKREYPVDFVMPFEDKYLVNIMLPEGYRVESIPDSEVIQFKGGEAQFSYVGKVNGKFLQFSINLEINKSLISSEDYPIFKDFFEKIIEKQTQQIVLTKA